MPADQKHILAQLRELYDFEGDLVLLSESELASNALHRYWKLAKEPEKVTVEDKVKTYVLQRVTPFHFIFLESLKENHNLGIITSMMNRFAKEVRKELIDTTE